MVFPPERVDVDLALFGIEEGCTWESTGMAENLLVS